MPSCHPYEVRARGSERSRRVRFGTGPGSLEKVAVLRSRFLKTQASLHGRRSRCLAAALPAGKACQGLQKRAVAPAKTFLIVGRGVAARARALTTVLTPLSIFSRRFKQAPGAR